MNLPKIVQPDRPRGLPAADNAKVYQAISLAVDALKAVGIASDAAPFYRALAYKGGMNDAEVESLRVAAGLIRENRGEMKALSHFGPEDALVDLAVSHSPEEVNMDTLADGIGIVLEKDRATRALKGDFLRSQMEVLESELITVGSLWDRGVLEVVGVHKDEVLKLAQDQERVAALFLMAQEYKSFIDRIILGLNAKGGSRSEIMKNFLPQVPSPFKESRDGFEVVSFAILMALSNRTSGIGVYRGFDKKVLPTSDRDVSDDYNFFTLSNDRYWRSMVSRWVIHMFDRFSAVGVENPSLVMLGDGSGQLGATIVKALSQSGRNPANLFHFDIGEGMLLDQQAAYRRVGFNASYPIQASVLDVEGIMREGYAQDYQGGIWIGHELLDTLNHHLLLTTQREDPAEFYYQVDPGNKDSVNLYVGDPTHPILGQVEKYFPYYRSLGPDRMIPFSVEYLLAIQAMMQTDHPMAFYLGDYATEAIFNTRTVRDIQIMTFSKEEGRKGDHHSILYSDHPVDVTAGIDDNLLYLVHAFGGRIFDLFPQFRFMAQLDPTVEARFRAERARISAKLKASYDPGEERLLISDQVKILELFSPFMMAATGGKGI